MDRPERTGAFRAFRPWVLYVGLPDKRCALSEMTVLSRLNSPFAPAKTSLQTRGATSMGQGHRRS